MASKRTRREDPFAMLPDEVLRSDACRTLPHPPHRVLVALAAQFYGKNNGSLSLTRKTAAEYGLGNPYALERSLRELEERGLIVRTRPGSRIPPRSAFYALTWWPIHDPKPGDPHDARPTVKESNAWAAWRAQPPKKKKSPVQYWSTATKKQREPMYPRDTRTSIHGMHAGAEMSNPGIHAEASSPVTHGYASDICTVGASER